MLNSQSTNERGGNRRLQPAWGRLLRACPEVSRRSRVGARIFKGIKPWCMNFDETKDQSIEGGPMKAQRFFGLCFFILLALLHVQADELKSAAKRGQSV